MKFGMPSGVEVFFSVASFTVTAFLIGRLGNASLAANTIAVSINMMSFLPLLGMSEATGIISGKYIGRGEHDISEAATYRSWKMSICYMALMSFIFLVFPELLFGFFRPEKSGPVDFGEIMSYSRPLLACAALFNLFNVTRFIFLGALSGAGDTRVPMLIVMLCAWGILVPGVLFIILYLQLSVIAVWGYMVFYLFILSSLIFLRFYSGAWRRIDLIKRKPIPAEALDLETDSPHIR
jgi:MATE family multidrug resistance protein